MEALELSKRLWVSCRFLARNYSKMNSVQKELLLIY